METSRATVNTYDYSRNNSPRRRAKIAFDKILGFSIVAIILVAGFYIMYKYNNDAKLNEIDKMIAHSIKNMQEVVTDPDFNSTYQLVVFPDSSGIVSQNGKIINPLNLDLNEFEDGFIMMYSETDYYYELQYEGYCITKDIDSEVYKVNIFTKCTSEKMTNVKK